MTQPLTVVMHEVTALGPDVLVGGEKLPRRIPGTELAVPAAAGDTIELLATASAEAGGTPIDLDVWLLDAHGRDRRALSGSVVPGGIPAWSIPAWGIAPAQLEHRFQVREHDPVDGLVHLVLVAGSPVGARKLHTETTPLTWSAHVHPEGDTA